MRTPWQLQSRLASPRSGRILLYLNSNPNISDCLWTNAFKQRASGPNTIEYKIGEIFGEIRNKIQSGCNLHTVLDCPGGTFLGAGVKTVVLFFEKGAPTRKVWFYTGTRHDL